MSGTNFIIPRDGSITIEDGAGTPLSQTLAYDEGDLQVGEFKEGQRAVQHFLARQTIVGLRKMDEEPLEFSFSALLNDLSDGTNKLLLDMVRKTGAYAASTSTCGANADVHTYKLTWSVERTDYGGAADATLVFDYVHLKAAIAEGVPTKINITGTAYVFNGSGITVT